MEQSFSDISLYHEYRSARETEHLVSQKTWDDLNLDDFFEWADRTSSCVGRQYLYDVLHYNRLSEISEQEEVIRKLSADKELRAEIRSELRKLDTPDAYTIASLFSISHPVYSRRFYRLLTILQFAPFVLLGIVYITSSLYVLGILCTSVLVNMVLHYRSKARIQGYFFPFLSYGSCSGKRRSWHRFRCVHPCIGISKRLCRHCIRCERNFPLSVSVSDWRATSPFSLISSPR